jgi:hypothetical protein
MAGHEIEKVVEEVERVRQKWEGNHFLIFPASAERAAYGQLNVLPTQ